jgi:phosphatidylglycerophosphate synthase
VAEATEAFTKTDRGYALPLLRRLSAWAVPRVPASVTPNHLTLAGMAGLAVSGAAFALSRFGTDWLVVAALGLLAHPVLDAVDGDLARARGAHSRRGVFLDLFCDNVGAACVGAGLILCPYATTPIAALAYVAYSVAAMSGFMCLVMLREMPMPEIGPTETAVLLAVVALATFALGGACRPVAGLCLSPLDVAALGWMVLAVKLTVTLGRSIYRQLGAADRTG